MGCQQRAAVAAAPVWTRPVRIPLTTRGGRQLIARPAQPHAEPVGEPDDLLGQIESLYRAHFGRFLRVAAAVVGDAELARDAVQEAFASAIRHRGDFRGEGPLEAWIWRTVVNTASKHRRRVAPEAAETRGEEAAVEAAEAGTTRDVALRALVAALPQRQRLILFLRYYADLDYRGIAEALGIEPGTVGAALNAARAALRPALGGSP